ncbi:MAG: IS200/IS605 family transposase [Fidelibacterota bacterium]
MLHSHTKIWIHLIWGTKNHERIMFSEQAKEIHSHLLSKSKELEIPFEILRIQPEHVHSLINLPSNKLLSEFIQTIKGETSSWVNKQKLLNTKFSWQRGFGAFSVSASQFDIVKNYIKNQEDHHRRKTFKEEYDEWRERYGILYE